MTSRVSNSYKTDKELLRQDEERVVTGKERQKNKQKLVGSKGQEWYREKQEGTGA